MLILALGLDHRTDVCLRERLAIPAPELSTVVAALRDQIGEGVVISTCNRTEVYVLVDHRGSGRRAVERFLADVRGVPIEDFAPELTEYWQEDAVRHLYRLAVGLESLVVGEHQILGQIRSAADAARATGRLGPLMTRLFRDALEVGKRARVESGIARNAVSVSTAAVELAQKAAGPLRECSVLLIGAGKMSAIAARSLASKRTRRLVVTSRQRSRADELARQVAGESRAYEDLAGSIAGSDVVISATSAPSTILSEGLVREAMASRPERPLVLVDIAVPRDVEQGVDDIPNCTVFNIDDLAAVQAANMAARRLEGSKVEAMIELQVDKFIAWRLGRDVAPTIATLVEQAEKIRLAEVDRAMARLGSLSDRDRNAVNAMTVAIVNKLLHRPIVQLKERGGHHDVSVYVHAVRELFGLPNPERE